MYAIRSYYDYVLETAEGQRAWAFCPAGERPDALAGWMLHGWFA